MDSSALDKSRETTEQIRMETAARRNILKSAEERLQTKPGTLVKNWLIQQAAAAGRRAQDLEFEESIWQWQQDQRSWTNAIVISNTIIAAAYKRVLREQWDRASSCLMELKAWSESISLAPMSTRVGIPLREALRRSALTSTNVLAHMGNQIQSRYAEEGQQAEGLMVSAHVESTLTPGDWLEKYEWARRPLNFQAATENHMQISRPCPDQSEMEQRIAKRMSDELQEHHRENRKLQSRIEELQFGQDQDLQAAAGLRTEMLIEHQEVHRVERRSQGLAEQVQRLRISLRAAQDLAEERSRRGSRALLEEERAHYTIEDQNRTLLAQRHDLMTSEEHLEEATEHVQILLRSHAERLAQKTMDYETLQTEWNDLNWTAEEQHRAIRERESSLDEAAEHFQELRQAQDQLWTQYNELWESHDMLWERFRSLQGDLFWESHDALQG